MKAQGRSPKDPFLRTLLTWRGLSTHHYSHISQLDKGPFVTTISSQESTLKAAPF